ncbi:MAG TPA: chemotaxis protein CheD [Thermoclostridium caenicola]|uniref:Probable chemoreceptor glutamine deamidase CheD n=1 Tax=Thermoclostridium caenicola TaxID=659425 RepID=A0A1M6G048_9FIRM|nr:chemotaxis protein CheD [Thermoclostridium caenicola]SHJ03341.1 chemotaxis protein CheD [Thermoclostridium caenicola]HOK42909.1 chemotaxis protein CheD [Thermoclostridium caenicola]HOL85251.1 chemotaxis protein CheD [Thermoclostridium caenicola]HPO75860.1 chemotaxis protein CheD [Thermoclostridium caenicola]
MAELIKVGMAELKVARHPAILTTLGLGSCIGIALYDSRTKNIGLVHIMLPSSSIATAGMNRAKFADTGIQDLVQEMVRIGSDIRNIVAKIAGGAQMFAFATQNETMKIGQRNAEASRAVLASLNIPLVAEDTGGNYGRTIELSSEDGTLKVKTIGFGIKYL